VVNGTIIYLIGSYDFLVNRRNKLTNNCNEQHKRVSSTCHDPQIVYLGEAPEYIDARQIKHVYNFDFILFISSGLGMCDRLNSLICNDRLNSQWRLRHLRVIGKELNTV